MSGAQGAFRAAPMGPWRLARASVIPSTRFSLRNVGPPTLSAIFYQPVNQSPAVAGISKNFSYNATRRREPLPNALAARRRLPKRFPRSAGARYSDADAFAGGV